MNKTESGKDIIRIAIDGPGGAGKSTVAKALAQALSIDYIDTGAMYRAAGYKILREGVDLSDEAAVGELMENTTIDFSGGNIILDGEPINDRIRTPEISHMASACSALSVVRAKLVALQRKLGEGKSVVMDGRDIGSNVLPQAEFKFFLTAAPEERARRRMEDFRRQGRSESYEEVLRDIMDRDARDAGRALNPLKQASDAMLVDTTDLNEDDTIDYLLSLVRGPGK